LSSILAQKRSHIVASTMPKCWVGARCGNKGVIAIDRFRVASATKLSSKKTSEGLHTQFRRLPEIQRRPEWRRFLDGCPRNRQFPVIIATKRSSRTLLDSRPLEVCAQREGVLTHTHWRPHFQILSGLTVSIDCVNVTEDLSSLKSWGYTASNWCTTAS